MTSSSASPRPSTLLRLAPLRLCEIPAHPDLPLESSSSGDEQQQQPRLLPFITTLLNDGLAFLSPPTFSAKFKHHSVKRASPSAADVEVLTYSIPVAQLEAQVPWAAAAAATSPASSPPHSAAGNGSIRQNATPTGSGGGVRRARPARLQAEHWFARRSRHANVSSKSTARPGHASWEEFLYGLRDDHSQHEQDFTPTLYDARKVVDWAGQIAKLEAEGSLGAGAGAGFRNVTIGVYEMCHQVPVPMKPRCFGVLVVTASVVLPPLGGAGAVEREQFIAVTVPVHLGPGTKPAFYANGRNVKEGENERQRRDTVQALYCAAETCTLRQNAATGEQEIDWVMATASDAKGVLPMWMQKLALPGTLPKDVGYFIKWIGGVDDGLIDG